MEWKVELHTVFFFSLLAEKDGELTMFSEMHWPAISANQHCERGGEEERKTEKRLVLVQRPISSLFG